jgi:hypothetical protein
MIHVLTVHWQDDMWVDVQLAYLRRHIEESYSVYAFLNDLPRDHRAKYFYSSTEPISHHAVKLNILADLAAFNKISDDDLLMFIDGDAFPIGNVVEFGREKLSQYPLVAVQRRENNEDIQPHPCFCLTTVKFWKDVQGDWKKGYTWENPQGMTVTDVGGNLLGILRERNIDWYPMLRSNKRNIHPVHFGLYDDLVYHHGAGFRRPITRHDRVQISKQRQEKTRFGGMKDKFYELVERLPVIPHLQKLKRADPAEGVIKENMIKSQQIYQSIKADPNFFTYFQQLD